MYALSLHIFRRDLRIEDNTALIAALSQSEKVIPCFIFDPIQINSNHNAYKSDASFQFMLESLNSLQQQFTKKNGRLFLFHGDPLAVLKTLLMHLNIEAVFFNHDYTPFSIKRDLDIISFCHAQKIHCHPYHDLLLQPPGNVLKENEEPYTVFTPFYKKSCQLEVLKPQSNRRYSFYIKDIPGSTKLEKFISKSHPNTAMRGGRENCERALKTFVRHNDYIHRDFPAIKATSKLSAHLKFNTYSVREIYYYLKDKIDHADIFLRELYWRDFFTHITYFYPFVIGQSFRKKFEKLAWQNNKNYFKKWCSGETGFPIVDAGMRELNETGYMHNRVRLITASFLVKDLHIDWRWGEQYFATRLVDYDPAVNNGNWQWVAGTGCDAQPYFRIFNPWLQQKKFDPHCEYIKLWIPEIKSLDPKTIHQWYDAHGKYRGIYPSPMVNHSIESHMSKKIYGVINDE